MATPSQKPGSELVVQQSPIPAAPHVGSTVSSVAGSPRIEVAGIVTLRSLRSDPSLPLAFFPESDAAARFRRLARRLQRSPNSRIIGITSANRAEGKTTCAINLALAFAEQQAGEVLLIEASRRHPMLGTRLGFVAPLCFGLQMEDALSHASYCYKAVAVLVDNLHVLAFNPKEGVSPGLLNAAAFENTMRLLERLPYARIIVDCPNVLGSADINLIQDNVHQLLMSVRAGSTSRTDVKRAIANLAPTPISGTVLFEG